MFYAKNLKIIFLALLLAGAMPVLCMADGKSHHGTRVNVGVYTDTINLIIHYQNPSNDSVTIKEIKVFRPDGTEVFPNFSAESFPVPPFDLEPFESKGFSLRGTGVQPVALVPWGTFQIHADWKAKRATSGLHSYSVVVSASGVSVKEGFDIKGRK